MIIQLNIPPEFEDDYYKNKFKEALLRPNSRCPYVCRELRKRNCSYAYESFTRF